MMCFNRRDLKQFVCTETEDAQYVRGLREGIDIGLIRGIEKGLEKGAQVKAKLIRRKLEEMRFPEGLIREIVGELRELEENCE